MSPAFTPPPDSRQRLERRVAQLLERARHNPRDTALWEELANLLWLGGMQDQARQAWHQGVQAHVMGGQWVQAATLLSSALHVAPYDPSLVTAARSLARAHPELLWSQPAPPTEPWSNASALATGKALEDAGLEQAAHDVVARGAQHALDQDDLEGFEHLCEQLLEAGSDRVDLMLVLGQQRVDQQRWEDAASVLAVALECAPQHRTVRRLLADAYLHLGMDAEAREVLRPPPRYGPRS